jgi:hypothetical protein
LNLWQKETKVLIGVDVERLQLSSARAGKLTSPPVTTTPLDLYNPQTSHNRGAYMSELPRTASTPPIPISQTVCYLGCFFDSHLRWTHHCTVMSNRVRSSVRALRLIGNSVRGVSYDVWKRVWASTLSLMLFYGATVWYSPKLRRARNILQQGQDEFCHQMVGSFCTTPNELNSRLAGIPPVTYRLRELMAKASD